MEKNNIKTPVKSNSKSNALPYDKFPKQVVNLATLVMNNAEIRRYTSKGILNYLTQKGIINGSSKFVKFKWTKFAVIVDGLSSEYSYREPFFINCLIAAFTSFAASAERTIDEFLKIETKHSVSEVADQAEINTIVNSVISEVKDTEEESESESK